MIQWFWLVCGTIFVRQNQFCKCSPSHHLEPMLVHILRHLVWNLRTCLLLLSVWQRLKNPFLKLMGIEVITDIFKDFYISRRKFVENQSYDSILITLMKKPEGHWFFHQLTIQFDVNLSFNTNKCNWLRFMYIAITTCSTYDIRRYIIIRNI